MHSQRKQGSTYPYPVVVKRYGVASNQEELQPLKEQAASWKKEYGVQWRSDSDVIAPQNMNLPKDINPLQLSVVNTLNVGVQDIVAALFEELGFHKILNTTHADILKKLLTARFYEPGASKTKVSSVAEKDLII